MNKSSIDEDSFFPSTRGRPAVGNPDPLEEPALSAGLSISRSGQSSFLRCCLRFQLLLRRSSWIRLFAACSGPSLASLLLLVFLKRRCGIRAEPIDQTVAAWPFLLINLLTYLINWVLLIKSRDDKRVLGQYFVETMLAVH